MSGASPPKTDPAEPERADLEDRLLRQLRKTCQRYELLAANDRILVAISGGKDSYTMLHLLLALRARLPFQIELVAVHLDQRQPGYDGRALEAWLEAKGVPFEILAEDTYSVVTTHLDEASTYCSLCSRLRRGILYTRAKALGCNKIALGHHREDSLETFLLNLFFAGKLQAMPAAYTTDDGELRVIRPLVECDEAEIAHFAELERFPIVPCRLCGSQPGQKRDLMGEVIAKLETVQPNVRATMLNALRNVRPTHLLDREVEEAWSTRPPHIRPTQPPPPRTAHAAALPVRASKGRLPIVSDGRLGDDSRGHLPPDLGPAD